MGERTGIEWTDSTWNPVTGCTEVSPGCDHCYARTLANVRLKTTYLAREPIVNTPKNRKDPFAVRLWPERLDQPQRWRQSRMVFVNSMSDLFHRDIPENYVRKVFQIMLDEDRHIYQVLTKRPARAAKFIDRHADLFDDGPVPGHIWIGTSVENQKALYRVRHLRSVNAEVRFLSCEPLLGPLELDLHDIHWVIVGGESGPGARPMEEEWATEIRDQCTIHAVPFFFKQWGGRTPKANGRLLQGEEWSELPARCAQMAVA